MKQYDTAHGRTFEVEELTIEYKPKRKRRQFEPKWLKIPRHWVTSLRRSKSAKTYELALIILWKAFKGQYDKYRGEQIVLSTEVTDMARSTKLKAARELEQLGLIKLLRSKRRALRVVLHHKY
jgi:hypothetical protein